MVLNEEEANKIIDDIIKYKSEIIFNKYELYDNLLGNNITHDYIFSKIYDNNCLGIMAISFNDINYKSAILQKNKLNNNSNI